MSLALFRRNLAKCGQQVTIQNRSITEPEYSGTDYDETFSGNQTVRAIIKTVRGKTFFDGVNTERLITHHIRIEHIDGVTSESWILFKGRRFDIHQVENCCEQDETLFLTCQDMGTVEASQA